jgi:hypothetical protein
MWGITLSSPLNVICPLHAGFLPSALKMGATYASEMSIDFQWTTWCYIPEDRTFHDHCCQNLELYMSFVLLGHDCLTGHCQHEYEDISTELTKLMVDYEEPSNTLDSEYTQSPNASEYN